MFEWQHTFWRNGWKQIDWTRGLIVTLAGVSFKSSKDTSRWYSRSLVFLFRLIRILRADPLSVWSSTIRASFAQRLNHLCACVYSCPGWRNPSVYLNHFSWIDDLQHKQWWKIFDITARPYGTHLFCLDRYSSELHVVCAHSWTWVSQ